MWIPLLFLNRCQCKVTLFGRPNFFNAFQRFLEFVMFYFSFSLKYAYFFFWSNSELPYRALRFLHQHEVNWFKFFVQFVLSVCLLWIFSIKSFSCVVFNSNCFISSYGVDYIVESDDKATVYNVCINKSFIVRKWISYDLISYHLNNFS